MNIFFLSFDVHECSEWMVDRHIVKMILEYCQLLCTAHRVLDGVNNKLPDENLDSQLYKSTHVNHPSAKWVRESIHNYMWLFKMLIATLDEYTYRYNKIHASSRLVEYLKNPPDNIIIGKFTCPPPAMPDEYKKSTSIESYKTYYIYGKKHLHSWKKREPPIWIKC